MQLQNKPPLHLGKHRKLGGKSERLQLQVAGSLLSILPVGNSSSFCSDSFCRDSLPSTFSKNSESVSELFSKLNLEVFLIEWISSPSVLSAMLITETLASLAVWAMFSSAEFSSPSLVILALSSSPSLVSLVDFAVAVGADASRSASSLLFF